MITDLTSTSVTVKNQGTGAAGPFSVKVDDAMFFPMGPLSPGASQTANFSGACGTGSSAFADINNQVLESNEANNGFSNNIIC